MSEAVGKTSQSVWYASMITIFTVALNPPISQAADYWGRKWFLVVFNLVGLVGAVIISRAQNSSMLLAGFALVGTSFGSQSLVTAIVSEVLPRRHRSFAQASVGLSAGLGGLLGVVIGGALLNDGNNFNFRIYWYIEIGFYALGMLGGLFGYDPPPRDWQALKVSDKLRRLDWVGYALFAPGLAVFCVGLSWSENPYPWSDAHVLGPFIVGLVMMIAFIVYEFFFYKEGILHHGLWRHRNFGLSLFIIFVEGLAFFSFNSYFAMQVSIQYQTSFILAAVNFGLCFVFAIALLPVFGFWSTKGMTLRAPLVLGGVFLLVYFILASTITTGTPRAALWGYAIFTGAGLGSIVPLSMVAAQLATPPELITIATALMVVMRSFGGTIGLAINNAIFHSALEKQIPAKVAAATLPLGLAPTSLGALITALTSGDNQALASVPGFTPQIGAAAGAALVSAYNIAFRNIWITSACFCVLIVVGEPPIPSLFFTLVTRTELTNT